VAYVGADNVDAAIKLGEELISAAEGLVDFPLQGKPFCESAGQVVYELPCRKHRIFYQICNEKGLIEVLHIRSGVRSEPKL